MAGLNDTDIKLDGNWQLTSAANGDLPLVTRLDCLLQDIQLEALSQEGELFYDEAWGWSMLDFMQAQDDDLTRVEIIQRVKVKLSQRPDVNPDTIRTHVEFEGDVITIEVVFRFFGDSQDYRLAIGLDRVNIEVVIV